MDPIKEAFAKIKEDIHYLREELNLIHTELASLRNQRDQTTQTHNTSSLDQQTDQQTHIQATQTDNLPLEASYTPNNPISTGNQGVQTDRPTDQQTNRHPSISTPEGQISDFRRANEALESLDSIKKEIRLKFKRLTPQEMLVFSVLYSLEEQKTPEITYSLLARTTNLSESSIRDYIHKLVQKGVPIDKIRQNNKTILLKISQDLKNVATLDTILKLRDI